MFTLIVKKIFPSILSASILLFLLALPADAAIYMKIEGIDGESTADGHEDWIELLSVSESIARPDDGATGSSRRRGAAVFEDIVVEKFLDRTSPKLRQALAEGRTYPKVDIDITRICGEHEVVYFTYELVNSQLGSISLEGMSAGGDRPVEDFSLNFEEIKWTYDIIGPDCSSEGTVEAEWSIERGE